MRNTSLWGWKSTKQIRTFCSSCFQEPVHVSKLFCNLVLGCGRQEIREKQMNLLPPANFLGSRAGFLNRVIILNLLPLANLLVSRAFVFQFSASS